MDIKDTSITFTGPTGCGKTTLINTMKDDLLFGHAIPDTRTRSYMPEWVGNYDDVLLHPGHEDIINAHLEMQRDRAATFAEYAAGGVPFMADRGPIDTAAYVMMTHAPFMTQRQVGQITEYTRQAADAVDVQVNLIRDPAAYTDATGDTFTDGVGVLAKLAQQAVMASAVPALMLPEYDNPYPIYGKGIYDLAEGGMHFVVQRNDRNSNIIITVLETTVMPPLQRAEGIVQAIEAAIE